MTILQHQYPVVYCANYLCDRELPDHRMTRITENISTWYFCQQCLRSKKTLRLICRADGCENTVIYGKANVAYCSVSCRQQTRYYNHRSTKTPFISKQKCILLLLRRQDSDIDRIARFAKGSIDNTLHLITVLRRKGHDISLTGHLGRYHLTESTE